MMNVSPHKQMMRAKNGVASLSKESRNHPCTVSPTDNVSLPLLLSSILYKSQFDFHTLE